MMHDMALVATCDGRKASLYRVSACPTTPGAGARLHADPVDAVVSRWTDFHEHRRPDALGRGPTANAAQHFADPAQEPEEMVRRFARDIASWLVDARARHGGGRVVAFVAPRLLGVLRPMLADSPDIELRRADLGRLHSGQLAAHPLVRAVAADLLHRGPHAASGAAMAKGAQP